MPGSNESHFTSTSLLVRIRDNDPEAWQRLTSLFGPLVFHWFRSQGLGEHDAADALQDVFATVSRGIHNFQPRVKHGFRGWLWTISRSRLIDLCRDKAKQTQAVGGSAAWVRMAEVAEKLEDSSDINTDPNQLTSLHQRVMDVVRGEFEERTWKMFKRRVVDDQPTRDVADEFGVSTHAVRQAKSRILRRIREELGEV